MHDPKQSSPTLAPTCEHASDIPADAMQLVEWMLDGHAYHHIAESYAALHPEGNLSAALTHAANYFVATAQPDPLISRGFCIEAARRIYQKQIETGDYTNALKTILALNKLTT